MRNLDSQPTFSIISVIKNVESRRVFFRRCVESVLKQTFGDFEFIIQDGGSTDNTIGILSEYDDKRILIQSEPDSVHAEGMFRALNRCRGKYVGSCWSDEELLPNALEKALDVFKKNPHMAAFYGNYWHVDENGDRSGPLVPKHPFSIEAYACQDMVPPFCSSFFSREALERAGIHDHHWRYGIGEFEFWVRLANVGPILYVPSDFSYFGRHSQSDTSTVALYDRLVRERERVMPELFRENKVLRDGNVSVEQAIAGNYVWGASGVLNIEGPSEKCEYFMQQAERYAPKSPQLARLRNRIREAPPTQSASNACSPAIRKDSSMPPSGEFARWLKVLASMDNRLYYRDQSPETLAALCSLAHDFDPTVIVELGTLGGLSLRTWRAGSERARVVAIDLSFAKLAETRRVLPLDLSRVTLLEQDILKTDFGALWTAQDRVVLFVDAHDLPNVPIMEHVLTKALPSLPDGSLVVVDDLWFSEQRLTHDNARGFLENHVVEEIDELQCFNGHYAPYHEGGSFMGFAEVIPLLEFVNRHGIKLVHDRGDKHAYFAWKRDDLSQHRGHVGQDPVELDKCRGAVLYNPLESVPVSGPLREIVRRIAAVYPQGKTKQVAQSLQPLVVQHPHDQGLCYAFAVCLARLGMLSQAKDVLEGGSTDSNHPRYQRLLDELVRRVEPSESHRPLQPQPPTDEQGMTIFAMPKPFAGHIATIQKNAIRSWARLRPMPEIILFGDEPGIRQMAEEIGAHHIPEISRNEFGTPLVDKLFQAAEGHASHAVMAYVNADMILFQDFAEGVQRVRTGLSDFLLIGQRWDIPLFDEIDFDRPQWQATLQRQMQEDAMIHPESGLDYFVFRKGLWPTIPPFALGRTVWDNWLVMDPHRRGVPVVDGTECITAVHQDHDYGHMAGGRQEAWTGVEAARNRALAGATDGSGRTSGATYALNKEGALVKVQPRESWCSTAVYKDERSAWLVKQANSLIAIDKKELAACKCEEALVVLRHLLSLKQRGYPQVNSLDPTVVAQRYLSCHTLLAQCYLKMGRYDQVAATYTRLLENCLVQIPQAARDDIVRLRDQSDRLSHQHQPSVSPPAAGRHQDIGAGTTPQPSRCEEDTLSRRIHGEFKQANHAICGLEAAVRHDLGATDESVHEKVLRRPDVECLTQEHGGGAQDAGYHLQGPCAGSLRGVNPLDEIAIKHGTDKSSVGHDYMRSYYRYFSAHRKRPLKILEIGINRGCSLKTWHEFFQCAEIFAVDIDPACRAFAGDRIHVFIGDQTDPVFLRSVVDAAGGSFDIVIDDGGHFVVQQITSFNVLMPYVAPGGIYVIEDLHTSYWQSFGGGPDKPDTAVGFLKGLVDIVNRHGRKGKGSLPQAWLAADQAEEDCPAKEIESIEFCRSICFMVKRASGSPSDRAVENLGKVTLPKDSHVTAPVSDASIPCVSPSGCSQQAVPKVSVVLACHNAQQFLPECLDSILSQTMGDWELHVLDDGSTDGTRRIIEDYASRDVRIVPYYCDDNSGPYVRRNFAIERARAPFIVVQDADDIMCPDKLERLHHAISQDERLGVVGSFYRMFLDEYLGTDHAEDVTLRTGHEQILEDYRKSAICDYSWHGSAIIRKRLFEEIGLYDENPFSSDSFWLAKAAEYACRSDEIRLKNIPEFLTLRRMRADSQTGSLPSFDPRGRRAIFRDYRRSELSEVTQKLDSDPTTDVKAELRKSVCDDFVQKHGHLFETWENRPLTSEIVDGFIARIFSQFAQGQFVRCIVTCGVVERLTEGIAQAVRCYDLVRGLAYFALGLPEKSREYLEQEVRVHGTTIASEVCVQYLARCDVQWTRPDRLAFVQDFVSGTKPVRSTRTDSPSVTCIAERRSSREVELSVIVPDVADVSLWTKWIAALNAQTEKDFEVIALSRSGHANEHMALMEAGNFGFVVLQAGNSMGPWQHKNAAVGYARGRYVAFLGESVLPEPDFVQNVVGQFRENDINGLRGRVISDSATAPACFDLGSEVLYAACDADEMCVFRKDVFVSLGGYVEAPFARGAIQLSYRIYTDREIPSRPILYCPDVVVRYVGPSQTRERLVDRFAMENHFCINYLREAGHLQDGDDYDVLAFLRFVGSLYSLSEQTDEDRYRRSLDNSLFFERRFPRIAVEWARAALTCRPDSLKARYVVGASYASLNQPERACTFFEEALPPLEELLALRRLNHARSDFKDYANLGECYAASCTLLAQCYMKMGQYEQVTAVYTRLLENRNVQIIEAQREDMKRLRDRLLNSSCGTAPPVRPPVTHERRHTSPEVLPGQRPNAPPARDNKPPATLLPERAETANASEPADPHKDALAELEAKYRSIPDNVLAKHVTAVRLSELCRRMGQIERGNAYAIQALKIKNGAAFEQAKRHKPGLCGHKPMIVEFNVIARCNAGCIMCNYGPHGDALELDRFKRLADELLPTARKAMLIGGEVLLHPDFYDMCEYASRFGVSLGMTTNLCSLADRRAEAIRRFFHVVRVSVNGATRRTYESIRTHLSFDRLQESLQTLAEIKRQRADLKLELAFVAMRQNVAELPDTIEMAGRLGFDSVAVSFVQIEGQLMVDDSLLFHRELANRYFDLARHKAEAFGLRLDIPDNFDVTRQPFLAPEVPTVGHEQCLRPWQRVRVLTNGDVIPCCHLHSLPMGNAFADPFEQVWNGPKYAELREAIAGSSERLPGRCKHCQILLERTDSNDAMLHISPGLLPAMKQRLEEAAPEQVADVVAHEPDSVCRPNVTVIMACRDCEQFLAESLESVRNQSMQEWELFLLDDASTDGTRRIIEEYARRDPRIKPYYFDTNAGPYIRRNFAIERANTDFVVIHDSDDLMMATKLETLYNQISRDGHLAMVGSFYRSFFEDFKGLQYTDPIELPIEHEDIAEKALTWQHGVSHISAIIRRSMFDRIGGYDENPFASDAFWSAKLAEYSRHGPNVRFKNIPEYLTLYRVHSVSQTQVLSTFDPRNRRVRYRSYCECKLDGVRKRMQSAPQTDIGQELRHCTCSDFLTRFRAHIIQWENEPLDQRVIANLLQHAVGAFNSGYHVSCVNILNGAETMEPAIAVRIVGFDLLRGMAFLALDMRERSVAHLKRETQNHDNPGAQKFIADAIEAEAQVDVLAWCQAHAEQYNLGLSDAVASVSQGGVSCVGAGRK